MTATLVPPAIVVAIEILEALLAAEQGVASFAVSFGQTGSLMQDIATASVLRKLARFYLAEMGFGSSRHTWFITSGWGNSRRSVNAQRR